jgi:hypothetical protein
MSVETVTGTNVFSSTETVLAAGIGGVVAVLRDLLASLGNPAEAGELMTRLHRRTGDVVAHFADLGDNVTAIDSRELVDRTRAILPELKDLVGQPLLEGDML